MSNSPLEQLAAENTREDWLAKRRQVVGASEVAALFNIHPYMTKLGLWARKTGRIPEATETRAMRLGTQLESVVASEYQIETSRNVQRSDPPWLRLRDVPLGCTPDRVLLDVEGKPAHPAPLQIKTTNVHYGELWEDGPPTWINMQMQAEMAVLGSTWGSYAVLIGGQEFKWGDVAKHEAFCLSLYEKVAEFWYFVDHDQPPPETTAADLDTVRELYPIEVPAKTITLPPAAVALTADLQAAQAEAKSLEERIALRKAEIARLLGDAERGVMPDGSAWQWKTKRGYHVEAYDVLDRRELRKVKR